MESQFTRDENGVTSMLEFVLMFVLAAGIFTLLILNFNSMFLNHPKYVVATNQFVDVGNDVTTKIIDTYLVSPDNGMVSTYFSIPTTIAGYTYEVGVHPVGVKDREVQVFTSEGGGISVNTTLNGAYTTIQMNGATRSTSSYHGIEYYSDESAGGH
ncbi:MAG: hypothetical protein A4E28_01768 [Methanocella sp. PtaU1.Bin125]|nr:MAG: hypothetical protein A4E28_01768 [Methanocella sp. PtaU1.Bin125]